MSVRNVANHSHDLLGCVTEALEDTCSTSVLLHVASEDYDARGDAYCIALLVETDEG